MVTSLPEAEAKATVARFREHDEALIEAQHEIYTDENVLMQSVTEAANELKSLFEADRLKSELDDEVPSDVEPGLDSEEERAN